MLKEELYQQLLEANGRTTQCLKAIEEAGEFIQAMSKLIGENKGIASVIEEIADIRIMLEQMEYIWGIQEDVIKEMSMKLARQEVRMYGEN